MRYKYSMNCVTSRNGDLVLLFNSLTGKSVKITDECLDIINLGIKEKMTVDELLNAFEDDEDRKYFTDLFGLLFENKILVDNDEIEKFDMDSIIVELTHRCNLHCIHCSASAGTMADKEILTTEELKKVLDKVIALKPRIICVTGGEPMVRSDFWEIAEYLKANANSILTIMTNGTLINEKNVDRLVEIFSGFDISLDGVDEYTCSHIRGKGVFGKVVNAVKLLKERNVPQISLSMVDVSYTHEHIDDFNKLNEELGTTPIVRAFDEFGRGKENAQELKNTAKSKMSMGEMRRIAEQIGREERERADGFSCGAARVEFFVNNVGDLYPCAPLSQEEFKITSVLNNDNFVDDMLSLNYLNSKGYQNLLGLHPYNVSECKDCPYNMFCWDCLHDLYEKRKNPEVFASRCSLMKEELKCMW